MRRPSVSVYPADKFSTQKGVIVSTIRHIPRRQAEIFYKKIKIALHRFTEGRSNKLFFIFPANAGIGLFIFGNFCFSIRNSINLYKPIAVIN
jgi:hypothetical protein